VPDWSPIDAVAPAGVSVQWAAVEWQGGLRVEWSARNEGRSPVAVERVGLRLDARPARVLEHGWQSWSVVRRCAPGDVRSERAMGGFVPFMYLADGERAGTQVAGDQFLLGDDGLAGFLDGRRHLGVVACDPTGPGVTAWALLDGVTLAPGEERALDPLWLASGDPGALYSAFAGLWGAEMGARAAGPAPLGWCSWYQYFSNLPPSAILSNLDLAVDHGVQLIQIDDGYQAGIGDWLDGREGWGPDGTRRVAAAIRERGAQAGIWTAPFLADEGGTLAAAHPDWLLRDAEGKPVRAMFNPVAWGGWAFALDTTNPALLDHTRAVFRSLRAQGFDYFKIDFCYAAGLPGVHAVDGLTRAQALRMGLEAVREGIGDDAFLVGCGLPLGQAVGVVDAMRVSGDVAPYWEAKMQLPGFEEAGVGTRNAIASGLLRAPMHRRLWVNDPDCVMLRPTDTELTAAQRDVLATSVLGGGAFVLLSDDLSLYGPHEWALVERIAAESGRLDQPLDLPDPFASPLAVRSRTHELVCDWAADPPTAHLGPRP
jgi:alpha-galactosidase